MFEVWEPIYDPLRWAAYCAEQAWLELDKAALHRATAHEWLDLAAQHPEEIGKDKKNLKK